VETIYHLLNPWWQKKPFQPGITRAPYMANLPSCLQRKQIEVLIGSRRAGKTTMLRQFINSLLVQSISPGDIFYIALDHPALSGTAVSGHLKNFRRIFEHQRARKLYLFLDEVQDSPGWETELKSLYDTEEVKLFCTGSTSSLIQSQGGKLTGRQIVTTIFPLSFGEMIMFGEGMPDKSEDYRYEKLAGRYLQLGGYPENVLNPSMEYMSNLVEDILARDILRLSRVTKPFVLKDLLRLVAASAGSRTSFNKLSKVLGVSVDTVREYLGWLETAFMISPVEKWTTSHSEKVYSQKKIYLWDNGVRTVFTGEGDEGSRAENAVFMELKRRKIPCGYYAESELEVDFVTGSVENPVPIEVKYVSEFDWKDKRYNGVRLFLRRFPAAKKALLISKSVETGMTVGDVELHVVPLWKFLLNSRDFIT
jgi:predicted AAA+ superfamily ATPase